MTTKKSIRKPTAAKKRRSLQRARGVNLRFTPIATMVTVLTRFLLALLVLIELLM